MYISYDKTTVQEVIVNSFINSVSLDLDRTKLKETLLSLDKNFYKIIDILKYKNALNLDNPYYFTIRYAKVTSVNGFSGDMIDRNLTNFIDWLTTAKP